MTKAQLIKAIARDSKGVINDFQARQMLESFTKIIKTKMLQGKNIYLRGFASFVLKKRAHKIGRNITKKIPVDIPAHTIPSVKFVKKFREDVKRAHAQKFLMSVKKELLAHNENN